MNEFDEPSPAPSADGPGAPDVRARCEDAWDAFLADLDAHPGAPCVVTVGKFDGVHLGHRAIIELLCEIAEEESLEPVVVTFDRNPLEVLHPDVAPEPVLSHRQQVAALTSAGIERVVTLPFTRSTAAMPAEEFVERVLIHGVGARVVLVGKDFRFGARGAGDVDQLNIIAGRHGVVVLVVEDVSALDGRRVSSTWIRELLSLGRIEDATAMLGRHPKVRGMVVRGHQRGRELGFPTANLDPDPEGFVPADGVYAAWATVDAGVFPAAVSIGTNPTFDDVPERVVEAHLLDVDLDLYDRPIEVEFVEFIRPNHRFETLDALIAQMHADVAAARTALAASPPRD